MLKYLYIAGHLPQLLDFQPKVHFQLSIDM